MGGTSSHTQSATVVISLSLVLPGRSGAGKVTSRGLLRSPSQVISRLTQARLPGNLLQTAARSTPLRRPKSHCSTRRHNPGLPMFVVLALFSGHVSL